MKITLLGSVGHINQVLIPKLIAAGNEVKVVTTSVDRQATIEKMGATSAVGSMYDVDFLTSVLTGADIAYLMISGQASSDADMTIEDMGQTTAEIFKQAIIRSEVKKVVNLSSVGANLGPEVGSLYIYNIVESALRKIPNIDITFIRPVGIYYNMFGYISGIQAQHAIFSNTPGTLVQEWVSPEDIAAAILEEINDFKAGQNIRYVVSDETTGDEVAKILGAAIGLPDLKWVQVSDDQATAGMLGAGLPENWAKAMVQMYKYERENDGSGAKNSV